MAVVVIDLLAKELSSSMVRRRDIRSSWDRLLFGAILFQASTNVQVIADWYLFQVVVVRESCKVVASGNANNSILAEIERKVSTRCMFCLGLGESANDQSCWEFEAEEAA